MVFIGTKDNADSIVFGVAFFQFIEQRDKFILPTYSALKLPNFNSMATKLRKASMEEKHIYKILFVIVC